MIASASFSAVAVTHAIAGDEEGLNAQVDKQLKNTPEQRLVVGPVVEFLLHLGWTLDQIVFGRQEWLVPKRPSEASRREAGHAFEGFPVDIAVFETPQVVRNHRHLPLLIECKVPDEQTGVHQLEIYMGLEPHVKLGVWTNSPDPSAPAVFIYRSPSGGFTHRHRPLADLPHPGDRIHPDAKRLRFDDLTTPSEAVLRRVVEDLLDHAVANDTQVTRREEQLDQICNLLLLKLDSDKHAKASHESEPAFRPRASPSATAQEMRREFQALVKVYPEVFRETQDQQLRLSDDTIFQCVERLAPYRLIDVGVSTIAVAFQVLRAAALKQGEGQYFTPQQVIEAGVKLLKIEWPDLVIDPACGTGGFLIEVLMDMHRRHPGEAAEVARWAQMHIYGIDKDAIGVKLTKAVMQIAGDGSAHCVRADSIRTHQWPTSYRELLSGYYNNDRFTVVVTNPPFGENLKVAAADAQQSALDIAKAGGTEYQDLEIGLLFLQRAHQLLRVGGRLGIILPETYFFSNRYKFVLDWIRPRFKTRIVLNVPMEAFQGFCRAKTNFYVLEKIA